MANATEIMVEELDLWEKVLIGNARQIAKLIMSNQLGPIVLTPEIVHQDDDEFYGVQFEALSSGIHSN